MTPTPPSVAPAPTAAGPQEGLTEVSIFTKGFPFGHLMAAIGAIKRHREPNPEDIAAMEAFVADHRREAAAPQPPPQAAGECGWWCTPCGVFVDPINVTYEETHDERAGGCGRRVIPWPPVKPQAEGTALVPVALLLQAADMLKAVIDTPDPAVLRLAAALRQAAEGKT